MKILTILALLLSIAGCSTPSKHDYWPMKDSIFHDSGSVVLSDESQVAYVFNADSITLNDQYVVVLNRTGRFLAVFRSDGSYYHHMPSNTKRSYENGKEIEE